MSWQKEFVITLNKRKIKKLLKSLPPFQRKVLLKVCEVPFGQTRSYKWLARAIGEPENIRQVARALSKNPYPVIIPCHRIIRSDGTLGGYILGIRTKKYLLDLEKRINSVIMVKRNKKIKDI